MNEYVAAGLLMEAAGGKDVLVLTRSAREARAARGDVEMVGRGHLGSVRRANGRDEITMTGGGRLVFRTAEGNGHRGLSVDVVYLDAGVDLNPDQYLSVNACIAARPGAKLVRA